MYPDKKQLWVDALRSGQYEQGQEYLHVGGEYCCLGVLCDIYSKETNRGGWERTLHEGREYEFLSETSVLPYDVMVWAGISPDNNTVYLFDAGELSALNDDGVSFAKIADIIEANL